MEQQSNPPVTQTKNQQMLALMREISLSVAEADTTDEAFADVLALICRFMDWPLGHIYIWSEAANALVSSHIWYMADASSIAPFRELSEKTQFHRGEGTLGLVWESGEALSILDVRQETVFVRQMPIEEQGIRAYFAFPVLLDGEVTAVLEFFSPKSAPPSQDMTSVINHVGVLLGLTMKRQQVLNWLRQSEAQLAEAQRTAHVGHWEWDVVHDSLTVSPELYRIYGIAEENVSATFKELVSFIHPDDVQYVQMKVNDAYKNGISFDLYHRIIRPDGSERVLHARGRPVHDRAGNIISLYGTAQDMTEQKEAELKLAQTVRRMSALTDIGQAVSATLDLDVIYDRVLTLVRPLIGAEAIVLYLENDNMLEVVAFDQENIIDTRGKRIPFNIGIIGQVWQTGESAFLRGEECVLQLSPQLTDLRGYQPQALMAVPIHWQDKRLGLIEATHSNENAFEDDDCRLLEAVASWTAIALGNAQQYEQLQRRLQESDALLTISAALTRTLELDDLLQIIVSQAQQVIPNADWAALHLLQPKTGQLELATSIGLDIDPANYRVDMGQGVLGQVMTSGEVINVADMQTYPDPLPVDLDMDPHALLVAPVESRQRRIGTLSVQCATPSAFTVDDEKLLTILGVQAGMAIENARFVEVQRKARAKAERQRRRMRYMAQRVLQAQEKERERIARELHDESGQSLTSLKISLEIIRSQLPAEMGELRENLGSVVALADKTMNNLRLLSHNLRPPGLDAYGLHAALDGLCEDFKTHTYLSISYTGEELPDLAPLSALSLYRFAQEAMTNVMKHAAATQVHMTLAQDSDMIILMVTDNGSGFNPPDLDENMPSQGAGLVGMVERLEMVNGRLLVESTPGRGSCLTAVVPYTKKEEE